MTNKEAREAIKETYGNSEYTNEIIKALEQQPNRDMKKQNPCETCGYLEGSPFCLQYCPYDAERMHHRD